MADTPPHDNGRHVAIFMCTPFAFVGLRPIAQIVRPSSSYHPSDWSRNDTQVKFVAAGLASP
jgi:hypothetical protein